MGDLSPRDSALVFARSGHGRGAQFRAYARIWRSQPAGIAPPGHRLWRALSGVRRQPPRVDPRMDTMERKVNSAALVACIQKKPRADASFILDVSVEAPPGITILFGPSGAGKSTLLDCLSGLVRPDAGKIVVG